MHLSSPEWLIWDLTTIWAISVHPAVSYPCLALVNTYSKVTLSASRHPHSLTSHPTFPLSYTANTLEPQTFYCANPKTREIKGKRKKKYDSFCTLSVHASCWYTELPAQISRRNIPCRIPGHKHSARHVAKEQWSTWLPRSSMQDSKGPSRPRCRTRDPSCQRHQPLSPCRKLI